MKYAIAIIAGKQFKLEEGKVYKSDHFEHLISEILMYVDNGQLEIGQPFLEGFGVVISQVNHFKDKKVEIRRYEAKSRRRRRKGHRQPVTRFKVDKIGKNIESKIKLIK